MDELKELILTSSRTPKQILTYVEEVQKKEAMERVQSDKLKALKAEENGLRRKERTHRLITRGAMLEAFLQKVLPITDEELHELLMKIFRRPEVDAILKETVARKGNDGGENDEGP